MPTEGEGEVVAHAEELAEADDLGRAGLRKMGKIGKNLPGQSQILWTVWSQDNV